ncbi:hypothetical protein [Macrococcus armenti]|uniref:hypothetical protein n=1 Tax=Macrococcus armenti TaxID=2875764 RepID=UPI001CD31A4D|nr:hypothetical protein [Macrococcus armenti]UBH10095.1 hypothetical protein LAU38_07355 [Macrococcus armenti]
MGWLINEGDRFRLNNENWEVIFINNDSVAVARSENGKGRIVSQRTIYKSWYEQQKQQINNLKTEILIINNDAVNSGDEIQMEITGRVIEALENTIVDDWRVEE